MFRLLVFVGVIAVVAAESPMTADTPPNRPLTGRSQVATRLGIVAASQVLAARAGVQVLERGGNAMDAAIATNAVMGLMEPTGNGIGGDLFAIVWDAKTQKLYGLNGSGRSPQTLTLEPHDRQRRREAGRAESHGVEKRQPVRHRHHPVARHRQLVRGSRRHGKRRRQQQSR